MPEISSGQPREKPLSLCLKWCRTWTNYKLIEINNILNVSFLLPRQIMSHSTVLRAYWKNMLGEIIHILSESCISGNTALISFPLSDSHHACVCRRLTPSVRWRSVYVLRGQVTQVSDNTVEYVREVGKLWYSVKTSFLTSSVVIRRLQVSGEAKVADLESQIAVQHTVAGGQVTVDQTTRRKICHPVACLRRHLHHLL